MSHNPGELQKWADVAMFKAEEIDVQAGPQVQLLSCNNDPLGTIAAAAKMYKGESVTSLALITDAERRHYLADTRKNALAAPLEFVNFHFIISGVTRGFTHQMVRQRTATYTQESTRFAVKEDVPVGLPPSLASTMPWPEWWDKCGGELFPILVSRLNEEQMKMIDDYAMRQASREQLWRKLWDQHVGATSTAYNGLVGSGMPAEDARGLLPTNLLTRINYNTSLRGLLDHSGLRLCTQAQFEWRLVWMKIIEAIRDYGQTQYYMRPADPELVGDSDEYTDLGFYASWQFDELATIFKPICYQKGSCQFLSDVDRACTIRERVQASAKLGRPSTEWDQEYDNTEGMLNVDGYGQRGGTGVAHRKSDDAPVFIGGIRDEEWMLDPTSARVSQ
jgi:flavin-dependent thymidylate synthase